MPGTSTPRDRFTAGQDGRRSERRGIDLAEGEGEEVQYRYQRRLKENR